MTQTHTARAHAKLAPSAAHRWMNCPGSIRLSEGIEETTSSFAAEGTAAHELAAHCLEAGDDPATFIDMWVDIHAKEGKSRFVDLSDVPTGEDAMRFFRITDEMAEAVGDYVNHVRALARREDAADTFGELPLLEVEQRLDMTHLHPEIFGTGDATVFDVANRHLHVVDFKYGKGVAVDATDNPQLLLYAAGAARRHHNMQIERLTVHIVQPRADHKDGPIRQFDIDLLDLFEFEDRLSAAAKRTEDPDAPTKAGDWCRFCPAHAICPTVREARLAAAADEFGDAGEPVKLTPPEKLSDEKLGLILQEADQIGNYVKAVQEYAHAQALAGHMPKGYKLVAKRAVRKWKDEDAARHALYDLGATNDDILTEPKLKSPAQLEKLFPGKNKAAREAAMAELVEKKSSGTNLAPVEDPRPAVVVDAASEFGAAE